MRIVLCNAIESPIGIVASVRDQVMAQATDSVRTYCYLHAPWTKRGKTEKGPRRLTGRDFNAIAVVDCPNPELLTGCVLLPGEIAGPHDLESALDRMTPGPELRQAGFPAGRVRQALAEVMDYT